MNPHRVTVTLAEPEEDGWRDTPTVDFTCDAAEDAECRTYPECDCEIFTKDGQGNDENGHPYIAGQECWLKGWFDNTEPDYMGADAVDGLPTLGKSGPIVAEFESDYVTWQWADDETTETEGDHR